VRAKKAPKDEGFTKKPRLTMPMTLRMPKEPRRGDPRQPGAQPLEQGRHPSVGALKGRHILLASLFACLSVLADDEAKPGTYNAGQFQPDPSYADTPYDAEAQIQIYGGKHENPTARPLLELGRPLYAYGAFEPAPSLLGEKNLLFGHLMLYGDWRTAVAYNDNGKKEQATLATRVNLDIDLKLTATERIHAFISPLQKAGEFTRLDFGGEEHEFVDELDGDLDALFFEGDVGSMWAGLTGNYNGLDLPIAVGYMPLLLQNGVWMEDNIYGAAATLPSINSAALDISNMDITFFGGFDEVESGAVRNDEGKVVNHDVSIVGVAAFLEAGEAYWEVGYGFTDSYDAHGGLDYHNVTVAYTRRYGSWLQNSVRVVGCFGQDPPDGVDETANGAIVLVENAFNVNADQTIVPYLNLFAGFDRPQSLARNGGAGGILKNTGINFETDGLTGFPKLDDTGNDTAGGAAGVEFLFGFDQQLVVEFAGFEVMGDDDGRPAKGGQYAGGVRYQIPLSNQWILRVDAMIGERDDQEDLSGARLEFRMKF